MSPVRHLVAGLLLLVVAAACPVRFDAQTDYDCGRLDDKAVDCVLDDDCDVKMGSKKWTCRDRVCVKDCLDGFRCAADGYCKKTGTACQATEVKCNGFCVPEDRVAEFPQLCCKGCDEGATCCPLFDADGVLDRSEGVCRSTVDDRANCGSCGRTCAINENCVNGKCLTVGSCDVDADCVGFDDPICCGATAEAYGQCFEKDTTDQHCGTCERDCTVNGRVCFAGTCITGQDHTCCGRACTDCRATGQYCDATTRSCASCVVGNQPDPCGAGHSCIYQSTTINTGRCVAQSTSPLALFAPCTYAPSSNPCQPGAACFYFNGGGTACMLQCNHTGSNAAVCESIGPCWVGGSRAWGSCWPRCPCPPSGAPSFSTCQVIFSSGACTTEPFCMLAGSATLGQPCDAVECQAGLTCVLGYPPGGGLTTNTCADPCTADGGCDADAGETCQLPASCNGIGYCQ